MLHFFFRIVPDLSRILPPTLYSSIYILVLLILSCAWVLVVSWENDGSSARAVESLCGDGRAVCPDGGTDGHEEAGDIGK